MEGPVCAYLARQQVHLLGPNGETAPVESTFVEDVRRREASMQRKTAWKTQGSGARFMGAAALCKLLERQNVAAAGDAEAGEEAIRAPADWTLLRRSPGGDEEVVAKSVAAYDLARDGSLLVTDGAALHRLSAGDRARTKLVSATYVTAIAAL
ncbi:MAG TPA: hypothetical protein VHV30_09795 [Polyangiaceae bacterium]|nr:hypothetical protein [Polyangiaceae bacterium]